MKVEQHSYFSVCTKDSNGGILPFFLRSNTHDHKRPPIQYRFIKTCDSDNQWEIILNHAYLRPTAQHLDSRSLMSLTTSTPRTYPFAIANAFTHDAFGGNPATIVFLDPSKTLTQEERSKFAKGLNQPVVVFLTPTSTSSEKPGAVVSFDVQYFSPNCELKICGHGAIAATKVILDSATDSPGFGQGSRFPVFSSPETQIVEFATAEGIAVSSRRVVIRDEVSGKEEDWFEIILPVGKLKKLPAEEEEKVLGVFNRAVGKESKVEYIGAAEPPFNSHLLIVLDESENLEQLKVDASVLVGTWTHGSRN